MIPRSELKDMDEMNKIHVCRETREPSSSAGVQQTQRATAQ